MTPRAPRGASRDERGAVVPFVAVCLSLLLVCAAFAIDLGMQRVVRRDMQALADVVALDLARLMGARTEAQLEALEQQAIATSVARNPYTLGDDPVVTATWGRLDPDTREVVAVSVGELPTAVEVLASSSVDFAFTAGVGRASRTAVGVSRESACLKVGSTAVRVRTGDSSAIALVNGLVESILGVDLLGGGVGVLGYQGLATANLTVADLVGVDSLGVGTVDELIALDGLTIGDLNAAALEVLGNQTPRNTAAIQALQAIQLGIGPIASTPISLLDLVEVDQGGAAALGAGINVLDLVMAQALVANGESAVSVPTLGLDLGLVNVAGSLSIVNTPRWSCGPVGRTRATSSQAGVSLSGTLLDLPPVRIPLLADLAVTAGRAEVDVDLARSTADLVDIECRGASGGADRLVADVTSGLLSASVTVPIRLRGTIGVTNALGLPALAQVTIDLTARVSTSQGSVNKPRQVLSVPPNDTVPVDTGSGTLGLAGTTVVTNDPPAVVEVRLLGLPLTLANALLSTLLTQVQAAVSGLLAPTLATLDAALIGPLSELLGLQLAGADLFGDGATCDNASLHG